MTMQPNICGHEFVRIFTSATQIEDLTSSIILLDK